MCVMGSPSLKEPHVNLRSFKKCEYSEVFFRTEQLPKDVGLQKGGNFMIFFKIDIFKHFFTSFPG